LSAIYTFQFIYFQVLSYNRMGIFASKTTSVVIKSMMFVTYRQRSLVDRDEHGRKSE
jgi:hypothetical protein